ncbi:MAG: DUF3574 domain-containing protein [Blastocatellia bacterium]
MNKHFLTRLLIPALLFVALFTPTLEPKPKAARVAIKPAAVEQRQTAVVAEVWRRTELYFGSSKPDGTVVTEAQFQQFVDNEVTPRFPDGLTVLTGYGQFRNSAGVIVKERSMELILLYPPQMRDADRKIEAIRTAYKLAFQQESVLRVDSLAAVSF